MGDVIYVVVHMRVVTYSGVEIKFSCGDFNFNLTRTRNYRSYPQTVMSIHIHCLETCPTSWDITNIPGARGMHSLWVGLRKPYGPVSKPQQLSTLVYTKKLMPRSAKLFATSLSFTPDLFRYHWLTAPGSPSSSWTQPYFAGAKGKGGAGIEKGLSVEDGQSSAALSEGKDILLAEVYIYVQAPRQHAFWPVFISHPVV